MLNIPAALAREQLRGGALWLIAYHRRPGRFCATILGRRYEVLSAAEVQSYLTTVR